MGFESAEEEDYFFFPNKKEKGYPELMTNIGDKGVEYLSKNPTWTHMQALDLTEDNIGDKGAEYLCKNTIWTNLQRLEFYENKIVDERAYYLGKNIT